MLFLQKMYVLNTNWIMNTVYVSSEILKSH